MNLLEHEISGFNVEVIKHLNLNITAWDVGGGARIVRKQEKMLSINLS